MVITAQSVAVLVTEPVTVEEVKTTDKFVALIITHTDSDTDQHRPSPNTITITDQSSLAYSRPSIRTIALSLA